MTLTGKNRSTVLGKNKHVAVALCPPHIPHGLAWDRTRASKETTKENQKERGNITGAKLQNSKLS
jgi:hypothetical protein